MKTIDKTKQVDHPDYYNQGSIECMDAMTASKGIDKVLAFCECNAFKYLWRLGDKDDAVQDAKKAIWYINKFIELKEYENKN